MRDDTSVWPVLQMLQACLCEELSVDGDSCFCEIQAGDAALVEYVGLSTTPSEAMGWVRLDNSYPSLDFPNPDSTAQCGTSLAHVIEVGIGRCFPLGKNPPTPQEYREAARLQAADQAAIIRAITCCLDQAELLHALGQYSTSGPQGGVITGAWTVTVEGVPL